MKADTLSLALLIAADLPDELMLSALYDDMIRQSNFTGQVPTAVDFVQLPVTTVSSTFTLPTDAVKLLIPFYDGRELSIVSKRQVEAINAQWRDVKGPPAAIFPLHEDLRSYRLFPSPESPSTDHGILYGEPTGRDMESRAVEVLYISDSEHRRASMDLPLALILLSREFTRESDHQDHQFAQRCSAFGISLLKLIGKDFT